MGTEYIDPEDGRTYSLSDSRWRSDTNRPLMVTPMEAIGRDAFDQSLNTLWRYRAALPGNLEPLSLGEGRTPLVKAPFAGNTLHFKLEWFSPTGSFKDRGAAVMLAYLRTLGVEHIMEDSSGNAGAAIAAYGAAAGMKVKILAPDIAQPAKLAQIRAYGADVQLVPGPRDATETEAIHQSDQLYYASHNWHPFFLQGTKLLAYELWEDFGFEAPDNIIIPVGAGSNLLGCDIGFTELLRRGEIDRLPRLFAAQPANCAPIDASFKAGANDLVPIETKRTIAEGTAIKAPIRIKAILDALRRSKGGTAAISEDEIVQTLKALAQQGFYVEPTCASAAAAATKLLADGTIKPGERTVVVLTGSGLKASVFMTELFAAEE